MRAAALLLCMVAFCGCTTTTFRKGDMELVRRSPMWIKTDIGNVEFYDGTALVARMTGYKADGTAEAIKQLGATLRAAGGALESVAVKTVP